MSLDAVGQRALFFDAMGQEGFQLAGITASRAHPDYSLYHQWVRDGMAGPMGYLTDHRGELRNDPKKLLASARSILCAGKLYFTGHESGTVSRYAWGPADYHDILRASLERVVDRLKGEIGPFDSKICVDTAPLLERSYARSAGMGWIGKNTCLINQQQGSWFFLGFILTSLDLVEESTVPPPDRCGTCRRCIDACPTNALTPYTLDARLCISTWTIEQKGSLPEDHRAASGPHLFGCDICQEVCPWNRRSPLAADEAFQPLNASPELELLASLTPEEFRARFRRTPLYRIKYAGLLRNVATVMGNSGDRRYLPTLRRLTAHDDPAVREHAKWAVQRIEAAA